MLSAGSPFELEPAVAPELDGPNDPGFGSDAEGPDTALTEEEAADWESSFDQGALSLRADGLRKQDEDDDSDFGFDDLDYGEEPDEDEDLDDDFDDEDDELDDDSDEFEDSDEL